MADEKNLIDVYIKQGNILKLIEYYGRGKKESQYLNEPENLQKLSVSLQYPYLQSFNQVVDDFMAKLSLYNKIKVAIDLDSEKLLSNVLNLINLPEVDEETVDELDIIEREKIAFFINEELPKIEFSILEGVKYAISQRKYDLLEILMEKNELFIQEFYKKREDAPYFNEYRLLKNIADRQARFILMRY